MSKELGRRALLGSVTTTLGSLGGFLVRFAVNAIIARRVAPLDLGDFTMAAAEAELIALLGVFSFPQALVQLEDRYQKLPATVLAMSFAVGMGAFLVALVAWPFVAAAHGAVVGQCFIAMAAGRVIANASETFVSAQMRRFHFHRAATLQFVAVGVGSLGALALAYVAPSPFVYVVRDVAPALIVVLAIGGHALVYDRASLFGFDRESARAVWKLGRSLFFARAVEILYARIDQLVLGLIDRTTLGYYQQARYIAGLPGAAVFPVIGGVGLRTFSALSEDPRRQGRVFMLTQLLITRGMLLFAIGAAVGGDLVVRVAFGPQWLPAGELLQWSAAWILLEMLRMNIRTVLVAIRRFRAVVWGNVFSAAVLGIGCVALSPLLSALGVVIASTLAVASYLVVLVRSLPEHLRVPAHVYTAALAAGGAAIAIGLGARAALPETTSLALSAAIGLAAAFSAYGLATYLVEGKMLASELRYIRAVIRPAKPTAPPDEP